MKNAKPFWKVIYILLIIGVIAIIAGTILGGFKNASLNIDENNINALEKIVDQIFDKNDYVNVEFTEDVMIFEEDITTEISGANKIDLVAGAGNVEIIKSSGENIEINTNNVDKIQYYVRNNTLYIKALFNGNVTEYDKVEIYIPEDMKLESIDATIGAGTFTAEKLMAYEADFNVGAGSFSIKDAEVNNLAVDIGMGDFSYEGIINNKADVGCAMGSVLMKLANHQSDYSYELGCFMGNINYGSITISGVGSKSHDLDLNKKFEIECGMGNVDVVFLSDVKK